MIMKRAITQDPDDKTIRFGEIGKYLGVGGRVVARLIKSGAIPYERDPLDHRCKLVKVRDLDKLKTGSLRKERKR
jgi:DNA-binding MarR family transcriptional regulator